MIQVRTSLIVPTLRTPFSKLSARNCKAAKMQNKMLSRRPPQVRSGSFVFVLHVIAFELSRYIRCHQHCTLHVPAINLMVHPLCLGLHLPVRGCVCKEYAALSKSADLLLRRVVERQPEQTDTEVEDGEREPLKGVSLFFSFLFEEGMVQKI